MPHSNTHIIAENPYAYLIIGAGRQGTAAAYDLGLFGSARKITLADRSLELAKQATQRVNTLLGSDLCSAIALDASNETVLATTLSEYDCALSAVPYYFNLGITRAAIQAKIHLCDMGGHTGVVKEQLALHDQAIGANISIVPDCGMGPGLINTMGAFAMELLDEPEEIYIYDAGLPQSPQPPWNYELTFHINGLTNEMDGQAVFIRNREIAYVDTLTEPEWIEIPGIGRLEAEVTSGGTSLAPYTFLGKLQTYENKVMRYPGHYDWLRGFKELGLFSETPIQVGDQTIIPRQVYHALLEPKISNPAVRDVGTIRTRGVGLKDGKRTEVLIDLIDYYDEKTGFTAMERLTGWHCSTMMIFQVQRIVASGVTPHEIAVSPSSFMAQLERRGINYQVSIHQI
jgi:lysine 6-dehydrogenase